MLEGLGTFEAILVVVGLVFLVAAGNNRFVEFVSFGKLLGLPADLLPIINQLFAIVAGSVIAVVDVFGFGASLDAVFESSGGDIGAVVDGLIAFMQALAVAAPIGLLSEGWHKLYAKLGGAGNFGPVSKKKSD